MLKNIAIESGSYPKYYSYLSLNIIQTGLAYKISNFRLKQRDKFLLPKLPDIKIADITKISRISGLSKTMLLEKDDRDV